MKTLVKFLTIEDITVSYTSLGSRSRSRFEQFSSDFEGGVCFLHLGGGGTL